MHLIFPRAKGADLVTLTSRLHSSSPEVLAKSETNPNKKLFQHRCVAWVVVEIAIYFQGPFMWKGQSSVSDHGKIHVCQLYWLLFCLSGNTNHQSSKKRTLSSTFILNVISRFRNLGIVLDIAAEFLVVTLVVFEL